MCRVVFQSNFMDQAESIREPGQQLQSMLELRAFLLEKHSNSD